MTGSEVLVQVRAAYIDPDSPPISIIPLYSIVPGGSLLNPYLARCTSTAIKSYKMAQFCSRLQGKGLVEMGTVAIHYGPESTFYHSPIRIGELVSPARWWPEE